MPCGHFHAFDWDCEDDEDPFAKPAPCPKANVDRRIRERTVHGDGGPEQELIVECPFRAQWPALNVCLDCEHFKGYALAADGEESFITCARHDEASRFTLPLAANERSRALRTPVTDVMSDPICVRKDVELEELAAIFTARKISGMPVVDAESKPIGIVTKSDLIEARAGHIDADAEERGEDESAPRSTHGKKVGAGFQEKACSRLTAGDLMTPVVFSLPATASLADAVAVMAAKGVHRVPVVSGAGSVVGVVSALDVSKWLGKATGDASSVASPASL